MGLWDWLGVVGEYFACWWFGGLVAGVWVVVGSERVGYWGGVVVSLAVALSYVYSVGLVGLRFV